MIDSFISLLNDEFFRIIISTLIGAIIALLGTLLTLNYQNKRWIFTNALDLRTKTIANAYKNFLEAYFKINLAGNIGQDKTTFKGEISIPIDNYLISINELDIWVNKESSKKLKTILGNFRAMSHEIFIASGKRPSVNSEDWNSFVESLDLMKSIVREEIRSDSLRKFIFSLK